MESIAVEKNIVNDDSGVRWITNDQKLVSDPEYQKIISIVHNLWNSGMIQRGSGHCYSMSDIVSKLLNHNGIESYLEECSLMVLKKNPPELHLVGYSDCDIDDPIKEIRTHVVCITKTKYPILIDLSIAHFIDDIPYICEEINSQNSNELSKYEFENSYFNYSKKIESQIPYLHQQSIIDRINTDKKIFSSISKINKIIISIAIITSINFIRGTWDFYQKYIIHDNGFGPQKVIQK